MDHKVFAYFFGFLLLLTDIHRGNCQDFGYDGEKGPSHWGEQYNTCFGKHQSPININSLDVKPVNLLPLQLHGFDIPPVKTNITNNGHTVMFTMDSEVTPTISGGPLHGVYEFSQLHFHWGENDTFGSEDRIDSKSFPMEIHLVFFKKLYRNARSALDFPDGLSVLAFFYEITQYDNPAYKELTTLLANVTLPHQSVVFENPPSLQEMIGSDLQNYYTYNGSLTTPPCSEVVTWIDFKKPIPLSHDQIEMFRALENTEGGPLTHNFRPIQPLGDRVVLFNTIEPIDNAINQENINHLNNIPPNHISSTTEIMDKDSDEVITNKDGIDLSHDIPMEIPDNSLDQNNQNGNDKKERKWKHKKNAGNRLLSMGNWICLIYFAVITQ